MGNPRFRLFLVASVIVGALLVGYGFSQFAGQVHRIEKEATAQGQLAVKVATVTESNLDNRAQNVRTWCDAINANRTKSKRVIPGWRLKPLNCKALEAATTASGAPIPIPTGVSK